MSISTPRMFREVKRHRIIINKSKNNSDDNDKSMSYHSLSSCYVPASTKSTFHVSSYLICTTIL